MNPYEILTSLMTQDEILNKTYHVKLKAEHLESITHTWAHLLDGRPNISLRDVKDAPFGPVEHFVLTVHPPIRPEHSQWVAMVINMPGAEVHVR